MEPQGDLAPILAPGEQVLVLLLDPDCTNLPRVQCEAAWVAGPDLPLEGPRSIVRLTLDEALGLSPPAALRAAAPRRAVVASLRTLGPRAVLAAARLGVRTFHVIDPALQTLVTDARGALRAALLRAAARRAASLPAPLREGARLGGLRIDPPWPTLEGATAGAEAVVRHAGSRPLRTRGSTGRIVHVVSGLGPGGSERQLTLLAAAQTARGRSVEVRALAPLVGSEAHFLPALRAAGAAVEELAPLSRYRAPPRLVVGGAPLPAALLEMVMGHPVGAPALALAVQLARLDPDVVHGWLDVPGLVAALAALLAGCPRVVVATRSVSTPNFPHLLQPWLRGTYEALAASDRVVFANNSHIGAADYAEWLRLPVNRFEVVRNAFPLEGIRPVPGSERRARRAAHGATKDAFVVAGVFRLSPEKRTGDFLRAIALAAREVPEIVAWHVGDGPDAGSVLDELRRLGLKARVRLFGRRDAPWDLAGLADCSMLTSVKEGLPNAVIESQAHEVPPVITDAGGAREVIDPGRTGLLLPVGDVDGLAAALVELARDPARRDAMGAAGRTLVRERFSMEAAHEHWERLYRARIDAAPARA